jgi:hypothetical protein
MAKPTIVKVRKYNPQARSFMPDTPQNWVEVPLGAELEELVRGLYPDEPTPFHQMRRYLNENLLRARDIVSQYKDEKGDYRNLGRVLMARLVTDTALRPLFGPLVVTAINDGFQSVAVNWQDLAPTITLDASQIEHFTFDDPNSSDSYVLKLVGQGARIPTARIDVSGKMINLTTKGRGLEWTDKARRAPMSLADRWLRGMGVRLAKFYFAHIAVVSRDGYFDDGSDAPDVVLTADTTKFQLGDLMRGVDTLEEENGFVATDMLASSNTIIALATSMWPGNVVPVFPEAVASIEATLGVTARRNNAMGDNDIEFLDRNAALVRYEGKAFGTEDERTVSQGITATYATVEDEIVVDEKKARVVVHKGW